MAPHEPPVRAGRPKSDQKAEALLGAAGERFPASGFQGTSMDEVAQRAGVSKQTVYSHFASKEALFQACIRAKVAGYGFDETTEVDETDLRAALSTLTRRFVDLLFDPEVIAMHRLVMGESASQPRIAELFFDSGPRRTQDTVTAFLQAQAAKGRLQIDQGRLHYAAMQWLNTAVGMYQLQLWLGLRASVAQDELETHLRRVVDDFCACITPARDRRGPAGREGSATGRSQTLRSRHLRGLADGFGTAPDASLIPGAVRRLVQSTHPAGAAARTAGRCLRVR